MSIVTTQDDFLLILNRDVSSFGGQHLVVASFEHATIFGEQMQTI
jgi:hypothetical protein